MAGGYSSLPIVKTLTRCRRSFFPHPSDRLLPHGVPAVVALASAGLAYGLSIYGYLDYHACHLIYPGISENHFTNETLGTVYCGWLQTYIGGEYAGPENGIISSTFYLVGFVVWMILLIAGGILIAFLLAAMCMKMKPRTFRKMSSCCGIYCSLPLLSLIIAGGVLIGCPRSGVPSIVLTEYAWEDDAYCIPGVSNILSFFSCLFWVVSLVIMFRYMNPVPSAGAVPGEKLAELHSENVGEADQPVGDPMIGDDAATTAAAATAAA